MRENLRVSLRRGAETPQTTKLSSSRWDLGASIAPGCFFGVEETRRRRCTLVLGNALQPAPGVLSFHLYAYRGELAVRSGGLNLARAGETLSEEAFFDLTITDVTGRRWTSKRLLPASIDRTAGAKSLSTVSWATFSMKAVAALEHSK